MRRLVRPFFCIFVCLGAWTILPNGAQNQTPPPLVSKELQQKVIEVFSHNQKKLFENPDVLGVVPSPGTGEIWIVTDHPTMVPQEVEGVPVAIKPAPPHLPPPPGVIVLKPGGVQEHRPEAAGCPARHKEVRRYRWRFCNPVNTPQTIPAPMAPPVAEIPHGEAEAIYNRHLDEIRKLPGVTGGGLGANGITIYTDKPELVPPEVEGLPVHTAPPRHFRPTSHTGTQKVPFFHSGRAIADLRFSNKPGTAGGIVLSEGKPWLVTAAHLLRWSGPAREQSYGPFGLAGDSVVRWNKSKVKAN